LREFIATRNTTAIDFLNKNGYSCTTAAQPEIKSTEIHIFPNPANNFVNVYIPGANKVNYHILNPQGRLFQKGVIENSTINISSLPKGIFIIEFYQSGKKLFVSKLIKV
jgi:hypothetical protein